MKFAENSVFSSTIISNKMLRLPIKTKIDLAFIIIFVVHIFIFSFAYRSVQQIRKNDTVLLNAYSSLYNLEKITSLSLDIKTNPSTSLSNTTDMLNALAVANKNIPIHLTELRKTTSDNKTLAKKLDSLVSLIDIRKKLGKEALSLNNSKGVDNSLQKIIQSGEQNQNAIQQLVTSIKNHELVLGQNKAEQKIFPISNQHIVVLTCIFLIVFGITYIIIRRSSARLKKLNWDLRAANDELQISEEELRSNLEQVTDLQNYLGEREKYFRELVEDATDMIYEIDEKGQFSYINPAMEHLSGYTKQELHQMKYWDLISIDKRNRVIAFYRQQLKDNQSTSYLEFPMISKRGEEIWIGQNVRMFFRESGWVWKVSVVARDITKLKSTQNKLEESERLYRLLSTNSQDLITLHNADQNATRIFISPSSKNILGYEPEELIGRSPFDLILQEDLERLDQEGRLIATERKSSYAEYRVRKKDGNIIWMESNSNSIFENGKIVGFQTSARDITKRKQVEFELIEAKEKAEEASKAKSVFLSMMSHEIRTPMNGVIGLTNILLQSNPTPDQLEKIKLLKFSGENLLAIINDILDFSKIEAGKLTLEYSDFDLRSLMLNISQMFRHRAQEKGLEFQFYYDEQLPDSLVGDSVRIGQIITNLLGNALKFTEKGHVQLLVHSYGVINGKYLIHFSIQDTGIGIGKESLNVIFESFSQTHSNKKFGGTGLGLSISKRLLQMMGSEIEVESQENVGSKFTFTLALQRGTTLSRQNKLTPEKFTRLPISILLVDDNEINQIVACNFLKLWGIKTECAFNGKEAVDLIKNKSFDGILMDLHMPEVDGYEATKTIRAMNDAYFKNIPIIALTASTVMDVKAKITEAGMNDYVIKPFNPAELHATISKYMLKHANTAATTNVDSLTSITPPTKTIVNKKRFDIDNFQTLTAGQRDIQLEASKALIMFTPPLLESVKEAMQARDAAALQQHVHRLKGSTSLFCIDSLKQEIQYIERQTSRAGELEYDSRVTTLISDIDQLIDEVKSFMIGAEVV